MVSLILLAFILVTCAAWESFEFSSKDVGTLYSFPPPLSFLHYIYTSSWLSQGVSNRAVSLYSVVYINFYLQHIRLGPVSLVSLVADMWVAVVGIHGQ